MTKPQMKRVSVKRLAKIARCDRCGRRCRNMTDWNCTCAQGVIVGFLCPDCQTPEENAEAVIKEATLDYYTGTDGLDYARPKGQVTS